MSTVKQLMKLILTFWSFALFAQQGINYKALIKDNGGNLVANQNITIQFQILQGGGMVNVYQETHSPMTDANGIVIVNIGEGTPDSGDYSTIDWGNDDHFLNVQIDTGGGLTDMGTTKFMAVPYALSAANAATKIDDLSDGKSDNDGSDDGSSLFLGVNAGLNDDGSDNRNLGVGFESLNANTIGEFNTATGYQSLFANTIGLNNTANGNRALQINTEGSFNTAIGASALTSNTIGFRNTAIGTHALLNNTSGSNNTALGGRALNSVGTGNNNTALGYSAGYSLGTGTGNIFIGNHAGYFETSSNKLYLENSDADADNALLYGEFDNNILRTNSEFQIGNPSVSGYAFPTVDGSALQMLQTDGNGNISWINPVVATGLGALDEGNGIGWRLIGRNPSYYGNIGLNAVDLSYSAAFSGTRGATGDRSTAMGYRTIAEGAISTAMGSSAFAYGDYATAMGANTVANSDYSTAMGANTVANGDYSTAMGFGTTASGFTSIAMGFGSTASGWYTVAMGYGTKAQAANCTAIGQYNIGNGNATTWFENEPLFEIGNGSSDGSRSNALTVYKNGNVDVGNDMYVQGGLVHSSDRRLKSDITKLKYGLETILQLNPVSYYWEKDRESQNTKKIGLIAQEVQPLIPELVREGHDQDRTLSLHYIGLIPVLINAIKEQQKLIDNLKDENKALKSKYSNHDQRLKDLETSMNK